MSRLLIYDDLKNMYKMNLFSSSIGFNITYKQQHKGIINIKQINLNQLNPIQVRLRNNTRKVIDEQQHTT